MFVKEITFMNFENHFPLWSDLNTAQKKLISDNLITQVVKKGTIIHNGNLDCTGLLLVKSAYLTPVLQDTCYFVNLISCKGRIDDTNDRDSAATACFK